MDERREVWPCEAAQNWGRAVLGQTPSSVKRLAQCHDSFAAQQGLESEGRCHGPDFVNGIQGCDGIGLI